MVHIISKKLVTLSVFVLSSCFLFNNSFAQRVRGTVSLGASAYYGDLQDQISFLKEPSPAFSFGGTYDFNRNLRGRVSLSYMGVKGDDKLSPNLAARMRNLSFRSNVFEFAILGEFDFVNAFLESNKYSKFVPYIFLGPGFYHFNPTAIDRNGNKVYLHNLGTEGQLLPDHALDYRRYNLTQLNIQFGGGVRYDFNDDFSIGAEISIRRLFDDHIDDVHSAPYIDPAVFAAAGLTQSAQLSFRGDEVGYTFAEVSPYGRGDDKNDDWYYTFQIRATFVLNSIHLGGNLDYYYSPNPHSKRSQRNPRHIF